MEISKFNINLNKKNVVPKTESVIDRFESTLDELNRLTNLKSKLSRLPQDSPRVARLREEIEAVLTDGHDDQHEREALINLELLVNSLVGIKTDERILEIISNEGKHGILDHCSSSDLLNLISDRIIDLQSMGNRIPFLVKIGFEITRRFFRKLEEIPK